MGWFRSLHLASQIGFILGIILCAVCVLGAGTLYLRRRTLRSAQANTRSRNARNRIGQKASRRQQLDDGKIFVVRTTEYGFHGEYSESKELSPERPYISAPSYGPGSPSATLIGTQMSPRGFVSSLPSAKISSPPPHARYSSPLTLNPVTMEENRILAGRRGGAWTDGSPWSPTRMKRSASDGFLLEKPPQLDLPRHLQRSTTSSSTQLLNTEHSIAFPAATYSRSQPVRQLSSSSYSSSYSCATMEEPKSIMDRKRGDSMSFSRRPPRPLSVIGEWGAEVVQEAEKTLTYSLSRPPSPSLSLLTPTTTTTTNPYTAAALAATTTATGSRPTQIPLPRPSLSASRREPSIDSFQSYHTSASSSRPLISPRSNVFHFHASPKLDEDHDYNDNGNGNYNGNYDSNYNGNGSRSGSSDTGSMGLALSSRPPAPPRPARPAPPPRTDFADWPFPAPLAYGAAA